MTASAGTQLCPTWAFDPRNRQTHPRTGGKWQPIWKPDRKRIPMSGYEQFVAGLLTEASLIWVYESLWVPIRRPTSLPDPRIKRRRPRHILCNDFYLPERGIIIEIYSGYSEQGWAKKYRHLERMMAHHRIPFLLLDVQDWELLKKNPRLLSRWIDQRITTA